jgi:hypothetical protein
MRIGVAAGPEKDRRAKTGSQLHFSDTEMHTVAAKKL